MEIITLIEVILIGLATLYLVNHYSAHDVPEYIKILVFISWLCCFLGVVLVPLDVYYTLKGSEAKNSNEYKESYETVRVVWEIVYWTNFILTWVVLPVLQEYVDAGDFTAKERMKKSIKVNLIIYGAMGGLGVLFIVYLSLTGKVGDQGIVQFLITFSNCFGIFLIIICLGFGLVYIPKRHFQQMDKDVNLRFYQYQAALVDEQKSNLQFDLEELVKLTYLLSIRKDVKIEYKALLSQILSGVPEQMVIEAKQTLSNTNHIIANEYGALSHGKIVALNKQVKIKVNELRRNDHKWEITLQKAFFLEDIIESKHSIDWRIRSAFYIERKGKCGRFVDSIEWIWYVKLEQIFHFIFGILFVGFSIGVFFAETFTFDNSHFFSFQSFIQSEDGFAKSHILCLIPLVYISLCVYAALFNMKVAGLYGLYPHHQTDAASLVFAALNFSRVSSPLVFNFLQMMKLKGTAFNVVMGDVDIAYSFTTYFPLILVFLILCNAFDVYGRALGWLGLNSFKFSDEFTDERIEEGKKLLYRARNNKERNFLTLNSTNLRNYNTYRAKTKMADYYSLDIENKHDSVSNGSSGHSRKMDLGINPLSRSNTQKSSYKRSIHLT